MNGGGVGSFTGARALVTFTTRLADTQRSKSEFYFMQVAGGVASAGIAGFPLPPSGWEYASWVLDSNFFPIHKFFYGAFKHADSSDSLPANDEFPFPGGYNPARLNDPGARMEITLEPEWIVASGRPIGPSPLTILWNPLRQFINMNDTMSLRNGWNSCAPSGVLTIWRP